MSAANRRLATLVADAAGWDPRSLPPLPPDQPCGSSLTRVGLPYELSASASPDGAPALRWVLDPAGGPADAVAGAVRWADRSGLDVTPVTELLTVAFPGGSDLRPDAPFVAWLGAVHRPPGAGPVALKAYACTRAAPDVLPRLAGSWPEVAAMAALLPDDLAPVLSVAATGARGAPTLSVYRPVRAGYEHQALEALGARLGVEAGGWTAALADCGLARLLWTSRVVLSTRWRPGDPGPTVGVDVSLDHLPPAAGRDVAGQVTGRWGPGGTAALARLDGWVAAARRPLLLTWLGVDLPAGRIGPPPALSVYGVPAP